MKVFKILQSLDTERTALTPKMSVPLQIIISIDQRFLKSRLNKFVSNMSFKILGLETFKIWPYQWFTHFLVCCSK